MKEISVEMPHHYYPRLRNITGSIYQLILLHEIMRRYYRNSMKPFKWSYDEICSCLGFSRVELTRALNGIDPFVTCRAEEGDLVWVLDMDYTNKRLKELTRDTL